MNQCGGLQGVIRTLLAEMIAREAPQLVIHQRQDRLERFAIPLSEMEKEFTQLHGGSRAHLPGFRQHAGCWLENTEMSVRTQAIVVKTHEMPGVSYAEAYAMVQLFIVFTNG